jgi:hypothetical protein
MGYVIKLIIFFNLCYPISKYASGYCGYCLKRYFLWRIKYLIFYFNSHRTKFYYYCNIVQLHEYRLDCISYYLTDQSILYIK